MQQMLKFHDIEQNSDEWFDMRGGRLTSSKLGVVMANYGKPFGEPAKKYAIDIAIEQITGKPIPSTFSNAHMERGHEEEPLALMAYEEQTFQDASNGGFYCDDFIGCSPDFNIYDEGLGEIKSAIPSVHFDRVRKGGLPGAHKWQCIGNLKFTGRDWIDFISFCSAYPEGKQLFIHRVTKEQCTEEFKQINLRVSEFKALVDSSRKQIEES